MAERITFPELDASAFQHPQDREATENLRRIVGFERVVAKFIELRYERLLYLFNVGSAVRVGENQYPRLHAMLREACAILDVPQPALYVTHNPIANAFTFGHNKPYVMIFSGLLDFLTDAEVFAAIGHEVGHIKCGHVLYNTMAALIRDVIAILGQLTLGVGRLIGASIEAGLMEWRRRSELSADRAALLVTQEPRVVLSLLAKLAGGSSRLLDELNVDAFVAQARAYHEAGEGDNLDNFYRVLAEFNQGSHPFTVERARLLDEWARSEEYAAILRGDYARAIKQVKIKVNPL
ncbi:MAG: peptidase M48 [Candidatus Thermofonsia Clade 1 bacterium]|uniref:Peptidase M48 n=1 Tax=Candidatus Thermofonsia Clade 1 bacterium TaxID=2364210 RepID=A0A2M8Q091_9CHLR|nr:MAG: peptidase M48 [Candidatus Thermofonsia Clade 1 bacterium]PJF43198.1 MAG: peptidase M48 [Candidatus Thermofonsia Clade 1 bacterium]RMF52354.1 MAG: M48 family peptidase [Chloroflexota bacterium]